MWENCVGTSDKIMKSKGPLPRGQPIIKKVNQTLVVSLQFVPIMIRKKKSIVGRK